jgi:CubicO group peptidase (beta-lactamase class C family)
MNIGAQLIQQLETTAAEQDFSGVISITERGNTFFEGAYGYANRSDRIKNQVNTRFGIASGTKGFTALAIGKLIQEGKLSLDTKALECVSMPVPNVSSNVTIQHLLTHTSGIGDYYDEEEVENYEEFFVEIPWYNIKGPKDYLPLFKKPMKFTPGEHFSYCNGGFILLGVIIEEVSGLPYQQYVEEHIFAPCGMTDSGYFAMNALPERTAYGYIKTETGWKTNIYNLPIVGASDGGAFTTVGDMQKFWQALFAEKVLKHDLLELFLKPYQRAESEGEHVYYGHGFWSYYVPDREPILYLEGCDAGVSFRSQIMRSQDLIITMISNTIGGIWPLAKIIRELQE